MSKRINHIDIARGIGIVLVVLGHNDLVALLPFLRKFIFSFNMPLFFFLSGYFLNTLTPFWAFVKKRFHGLLKPFFFTLFMIYFLSVSFDKMSFASAITRIVKSMYATGSYIEWIQLWFVPHLFVVSIYAYLFHKILGRINSRGIRLGILLASLFVATLYLKTFFPFSFSVFGKSYKLLGLPYSLDLVPLSGFFFLLGSEVRTFHMETFYNNIIVLPITGAALLLMNILLPPMIDLNNRVYDSFVISTLEAVTGILFIIALSRQIDLHIPWLSNLFKYLGRITLIISILHGEIQDFWGQKFLAVIGNPMLSYSLGFVMGVAIPVFLFELFVRSNPVASFWLGREAGSPHHEAQQADVQPVPRDVPMNEKAAVP